MDIHLFVKVPWEAGAEAGILHSAALKLDSLSFRNVNMSDATTIVARLPLAAAPAVADAKRYWESCDKVPSILPCNSRQQMLG